MLLLAALGAGVLVFFALLIGWTPHPAPIIQGVQGRYFIVPALLLGYVLAGHTQAPVPTPRQRLELALVAAFAALALAALITTLLTRYH